MKLGLDSIKKTFIFSAISNKSLATYDKRINTMEFKAVVTASQYIMIWVLNVK